MILSVLRMQWMCKSCKQQQLTVRGLQLDSVSSLIRGNASTDLKLMTRSHSQPRQDHAKRIFYQYRKEKRRREREMSQKDENNKFETEQKGRLVLKWIGYEQRDPKGLGLDSHCWKKRERNTPHFYSWLVQRHPQFTSALSGMLNRSILRKVKIERMLMTQRMTEVSIFSTTLSLPHAGKPFSQFLETCQICRFYRQPEVGS